MARGGPTDLNSLKAYTPQICSHLPVIRMILSLHKSSCSRLQILIMKPFAPYCTSGFASTWFLRWGSNFHRKSRTQRYLRYYASCANESPEGYGRWSMDLSDRRWHAEQDESSDTDSETAEWEDWNREFLVNIAEHERLRRQAVLQEFMDRRRLREDRPRGERASPKRRVRPLPPKSGVKREAEETFLDVKREESDMSRSREKKEKKGKKREKKEKKEKKRESEPPAKDSPPGIYDPAGSRIWSSSVAVKSSSAAAESSWCVSKAGATAPSKASSKAGPSSTAAPIIGALLLHRVALGAAHAPPPEVALGAAPRPVQVALGAAPPPEVALGAAPPPDDSLRWSKVTSSWIRIN